ncbi:MAG: 3,4-dihydroxy-2-butanone-4-phosphate synthase [Lysobacterales bacterium]
MNTIPELLEEIRQGRMVVVVDDEDRENEGDLIMAASLTRPEDINYMASKARGLICLSLTRERCEQLRLPLMVNANQARYSTNFTVSVEAAEGVTTGISAYDRAHTIRTAVRPDAQPEHLTQPGHVFPLMAQPGGVLTRAGHTEAAVDLALLAGLEPAGVLVELLSEDGSMARRPELEAFAKAEGLKIGTIADLIQYRMQTEQSVHQVGERQVSTVVGELRLVAFRDRIKQRVHLALVKGQPEQNRATLVRVHVRNTLGDVLGVDEPEMGLPIRVALAELAEAEAGVLVVLGDDETPDQILERVDPENCAQNDDGEGNSDELRYYGIGAQILVALGVGKMRVLSAPKRFHGLAGFGLEVIEYVEPQPRSEESA